MPNGIFLVRFKDIKDREAVLQVGHFMFDNKPLIVRPWMQMWSLQKQMLRICLPAIAGLVGKFQRADQATIDKTRLGFARVMIEVTVGQQFPGKVKFLDERGQIVSLDVEFEWKPTICSKCKGIGHEQATCRTGTQNTSKKKIVQKVWKPVVKAPVDPILVTQTPRTSIMQNTISTPVKSISSACVTPERSFKDATVNTASPLSPNADIGLFGLVETKFNGANVSNISSTMLEGWSVTTNSQAHRGGRVWVLWKPSLFDVLVLQYDAQFIHTRVTSRVTQHQFFLTVIYAFNEGADRRDLWKKLELFGTQCIGPLALAGDFNTVINPAVRLGGNTKQSDMDEFIECTDNCGMIDISTTGAYYTWNNKQEPRLGFTSRIVIHG
ncbi:uncharacterized protein LOC141595400 [Silene latifolia]|uniref:uncharacterized protein LOC141595400 n=1 Tax=Silene latifolia TaxID=37657 RepID=UPI003D76F982